MHEAILKTESFDGKNVAKALNVDNENLDNLEISTTIQGKKIISEVKAKNIKTLLNTLDDLIYCQMIAENLIEYGKE